VKCVDDANCSSPTPRCDLTTGNCVPGPDAGAPDAGPTDAGTDAGDAGDGGGLDAGSSGSLDGGGGNIDSGVSVAGPCQTDTECGPGNICSPITKTCVKDSFSVEGGGCGCRTETTRGSDAGALLGFGFLGALVWRRRRNRQGADR
jgi:MYXO-CTERM domain-containing protein